MAARLARPWLLRALRGLPTPSLTLLPRRLPYATGGLQRPPWLTVAAVATIAPPPVVTAAAGRDGRRRRRLPGAQCSTPSTEVQALFKQYSIDVQKVVQRYPHIVTYDVQRVERVIAYLVGLEVDLKRVVEKKPQVLAGRVEAYEMVVQLLRSHRVNVIQMVGTNPTVLIRPVATLQAIIDIIRSMGHPVADVLRHYPSLLRSSAANVSSTVMTLQRCTSESSSSLPTEDPRGMLLHSFGLDAATLLRKAPQLLTLKFEKINAVVVCLEKLGVNVPHAVRSVPKVLTYRPETLQQRLQFLSKHGLDALRVVNSCPTLLCYSTEQKLQPLLTFVVEEMGRPVSDLEGASNLWGFDLEGRLRPRFLFLKSLGKSPASLSSFACYPDEQFATIVAGANLQRYYDWRRQNGYSVPLGTVPAPAATIARTIARGCSHNGRNSEGEHF